MTTTRNSRSSVSPPPLSRASTPDSAGPSTPVLPQAFPSQSGKMSQQRHSVNFASSVVSSSYRIPAWDERSVMRAFASHASHCGRCSDPERTRRSGDTLCRTGTQLAKDIGKYFFCWDGKPYSTIDRKHSGERVQVEVPVEYGIVKNLFEALSKGLGFSDLKQRRPAVHHADTYPTPVRAPTESYEIRPSRTNSRRERANTYTGYGPAEQQYETRTPYDERYRPERLREPRREKRGSLYNHEEHRSKRKSLVLPFSSGWLG